MGASAGVGESADFRRIENGLGDQEVGAGGNLAHGQKSFRFDAPAQVHRRTDAEIGGRAETAAAVVGARVQAGDGGDEFGGPVVVDGGRGVPWAECVSGHDDYVFQSQCLRSQQHGFQRQAVHVARGQREDRICAMAFAQDLGGRHRVHPNRAPGVVCRRYEISRRRRSRHVLGPAGTGRRVVADERRPAGLGVDAVNDFRHRADR